VVRARGGGGGCPVGAPRKRAKARRLGGGARGARQRARAHRSFSRPFHGDYTRENGAGTSRPRRTTGQRAQRVLGGERVGMLEGAC
jgi:hypothetical protein